MDGWRKGQRDGGRREGKEDHRRGKEGRREGGGISGSEVLVS